MFKIDVNPPPERRNEIDGGLINKGLTMRNKYSRKRPSSKRKKQSRNCKYCYSAHNE